MISEALESNSVLFSLNLKGQLMKDDGQEKIINNWRFLFLLLTLENSLGFEGCKMISEGMLCNNALGILNLQSDYS